MTALSPSGNSTNSITSLPHLGDRTAALTARLFHSTLTCRAPLGPPRTVNQCATPLRFTEQAVDPRRRSRVSESLEDDVSRDPR